MAWLPLFTGMSTNTCSTVNLNPPTLSLTIPAGSPYSWSYTKTSSGFLIYARLKKTITAPLVFTIAEYTDSTSYQLINPQFHNCSNTALHTCSNLYWNYFVPGPLISQNDNTLTAQYPEPGATYQWYYNNVAIANATLSTYVITQLGPHSVEVVNMQGCSSVFSDVFTPVGIPSNQLSDEGIVIFPNPVKNKFRISATLQSFTSVDLTLLDMTGQTIFEKKFESLTRQLDSEIDLTPFPRGIYFLRIKTARGTVVKKLLKQD